MPKNLFLRAAGAALVWSLALHGTGHAQQAGSLDGFVLTDGGDALPGVVVTLNGRNGTYRQTSDERGALRILGMEPGNYALRAVRDGFEPATYPTVEILVGRTTSLQIKMSRVPGETIVVTSEPPLLATRPEAQGIRVSAFELDTIPTTRDPWAVVAQAPGVLLDTVNTGGNKSNLQPSIIGPGTGRPQNNFMLDGVQVTDMAAAGTSPLYYDFDQLEEVRVTVGGPDAAAPTAGVLVDLVTKRGTSVWRGSTRDFETDERLQASPRETQIVRPTGPGPIDPENVPPPRGGIGGGQRIDGFSVFAGPAAETPPAETATPPLSVGRIKGIDDYGIEGGGPLLAERLFAWGSFGAISSRQIAVGGAPDRTELLNVAAKVNWQVGAGHSLSGTYHRADKTRPDLGAGPERSEETFQRLHGRTRIAKLEDSLLLRNDLYLTALASTLDGRFGADPNAGPAGEVVLDPKGIWRGSYSATRNRRNANQFQVDLRSYLSARPGSHEPRLGVSRREFSSDDEERWGPRDLIQIAGENAGTPYDIVRALRPGRIGSRQRYLSLWGQDEVRADRLTTTAGVRFDRQEGASQAADIAANPAFPNLLPAVRFSGGGPDFRWQSFSPRLGVSWALGEDRRIVLRAGYSRFAAQLHTTLVDRLNPLGTSSATLGFLDVDGDGIYDSAEPTFLLATQGIDPLNPGA
ncbi:MAG TPA: carboxypeptidase regulatory-like domain-containing protein, partial [Thermoanaerobaculia bacterium]|nr:carboxypeptidase regulatory-like domain-containing protein [Thermoanaerobaculia bacterium]